jgi:spectinomycin phosphotransferase
VDWDTVALAPPERDLWHLDAASVARYGALTGRPAKGDALAYYRLAWDLADVASFVGWLRAPHRRTPDTIKALDGLVTIGGRVGRT